MKTDRFLSSVFALLTLVSLSCAQPKGVEQRQPAAPQLIWKYDTGG
jgi:hypothetical protein